MNHEPKLLHYEQEEHFLAKVEQYKRYKNRDDLFAKAQIRNLDRLVQQCMTPPVREHFYVLVSCN